jgi:hypothetical protein
MTDEKNLKKIDSPNVELPKVNESLKEHSFPIELRVFYLIFRDCN